MKIIDFVKKLFGIREKTKEEKYENSLIESLEKAIKKEEENLNKMMDDLKKLKKAKHRVKYLPKFREDYQKFITRINDFSTEFNSLIQLEKQIGSL